MIRKLAMARPCTGLLRARQKLAAWPRQKKKREALSAHCAKSERQKREQTRSPLQGFGDDQNRELAAIETAGQTSGQSETPDISPKRLVAAPVLNFPDGGKPEKFAAIFQRTCGNCRQLCVESMTGKRRFGYRKPALRGCLSMAFMSCRETELLDSKRTLG